MKKIAFITGATSGIGRAIAIELAAQGMDLIICGRREERLKQLQSTIQNVKVKYLVFDVRNNVEVNKAIQTLSKNTQIDILINNAGNAFGVDPIDEGNLEDWEKMIDTNVKGLLYVTKAVMPYLLQSKAAHIINLGSIAAKEVYPAGNVYCATKHAVDALTKGMRIDLLEKNIKVSAIHPGLVNTEFSQVRYDGDISKADKVYENMTPLVAQDLAEVVAFMVTRPAHVNIADILVLPSDQASATFIKRG